MSNSFGDVFRVTTFGESHGGFVGVVIDGCPSRLELSEADIQPQLNRRRPGQSAVSTPRNEPDQARIVSGVDNGLTLGAPIAIVVENRDKRQGDYRELVNIPRPSHADFTYKAKYGILAASGGGRASARETLARVAAGAVAEKWLRSKYGVDIVAWVSSVGAVDCPDMTGRLPSRADVDRSVVRCPDKTAARLMQAEIQQAAAEMDSVGGLVTCVCRNVPAGWGEPVFDKLHARLAGGVLSIPAAKGFEIGAGFDGCRGRGSANNDLFVMKKNRLRPATNRSGGVQGGISNGEPIVFRVGFKPTASIAQSQLTVDYDGKPVSLEIKGRHDPCVVPRAVVVVEAMAALVLADLALVGR